MKNTETKIILSGGGGYYSPKLEVIYFNPEVGFCQSGRGIATNDDLTEEEGPFFEWDSNLK